MVIAEFIIRINPVVIVMKSFNPVAVTPGITSTDLDFAKITNELKTINCKKIFKLTSITKLRIRSLRIPPEE